MSKTTKAALSVRTHFSLKESIVKPDRLGELAKQNGYDAVAITDFMSINGLVDLTKSCKKAGVKPILGCRIAVYDDPALKQTKAEAKKTEQVNAFWLVKLYAKNEAGVKAIIKLLARANLDDYFYYHPRTGLKELLEVVESGDVILLTGDSYGLFSHKQYSAIAAKVFAACGENSGVIELVPIASPLYDSMNKTALFYADRYGIPVVASTPFLYENDEQADSLDVLCAIASNQTIHDKFARKLFTRNHAFQPVEALEEAYDAMCHRIGTGYDERQEAFDNIAVIADACTYEWKEMPVTLPVMAQNESVELLNKIKEGWKKRITESVYGYQPKPEDIPLYKERLQFEFEVLKKMGFERYFLMVSDIVNWSKQEGILVGPGRGSCGGSLIAYLMGITDVDPIRFGLLFERFINPERIDLPDIDLDFASSRRHEVIDYIKRRFGEENVAGISNYVTLGSASVIRDVGRTHGLSPFEMTCTKLMPKEHGEMIDIDEAAGMVPEIDKFRQAHPKIWKHAQILAGNLRNYGKHAAGVVIAGEPVNQRAVIELRAGELSVNWDKDSVEKWGLIKVDILGLSTLDIIDLVKRSVKDRLGIEVVLEDIPLDDERVLTAFGEGKSIGIFQFDGGGVRHLLKSLASITPLTFDDLSAATALYRPGPMDAGLMDDYVRFKQGADPYYDHPKMENAVKNTGGVFIYQEQVMQLARDIAGYTLPEADKLRKIMGKKQKDEMAEQRDKFVQGCIDTSGMTEREAGALFDKVEKFAGYGFNKSHSVEYALISYLSMWFKVHYPLDFFAASMTVLKDEKMSALVADANGHNIEVYPPDINRSSDKFEIAYDHAGKAILLVPFSRIKGISEKGANAIVAARSDGPFINKNDFMNRIPSRTCNSKAVEALDRVGAFASIEPGQLPARHPDRLKDQLDLMSELCSTHVYVSRVMPRDTVAAEGIGRLYRDMKICEGCSLKGGVHPVPAFGKKAEIMIITDCPTKDEDKNNKMLVGDGAQFVKIALHEAGLKTAQGYFTSLVKSQKVGKFLTNEQINGCVHHIEKEIAILKPAIIVLLGNAAIKHFLPDIKKPKEVQGKVIYDKRLDANLVVGFNPSLIWFNPDVQNELDDIFRQVAELL